MKKDRIQLLLGVLLIFFGVVSFTVDKLIFAFFGLVAGFAVIFIGRGTGSFNERSQNEKIIKNADVTIDSLYEHLANMDTHLGKCWLCGHKDFDGKIIVFGPSIYGDVVYIAKDEKKNNLDLKFVSTPVNLKYEDQDSWRFENVINVDTLDVVPSNYSNFGSYKLVSTLFLSDLLEIVETYIENPAKPAPKEIDKFNCYMHNSSDGYLRDSNYNEICRVEKTIRPFDVELIDDEGSVLASVVTTNENYHDLTTATFEIYADGQHYAHISHDNKVTGGSYVINTDDGLEFVVKCFVAVRRANVSANFTIEKDGRRVAVIGGSPKLEFEGIGYTQNDIICSMDDDYLVLYSAIQIFIMTASRWLR